MLRCAAVGCDEYFGKTPGLSFHFFPNDEERKELWISALRRENFTPSDYSALCSKHFTEDCFDQEKFGGRKWLKRNAVPSIFTFPDDSLKKKKYASGQFKNSGRKPNASVHKPNTSIRKSDASMYKSNDAGPSAVESSKKKQRLSYVGDFKEGVEYSASALNRGWCVAMNKIHEQKRKMTQLQRSIRSLKKKEECLTAKLKEVKNRSKIGNRALQKLEMLYGKRVVLQQSKIEFSDDVGCEVEWAVMEDSEESEEEIVVVETRNKENEGQSAHILRVRESFPQHIEELESNSDEGLQRHMVHVQELQEESGDEDGEHSRYVLHIQKVQESSNKKNEQSRHMLCLQESEELSSEITTGQSKHILHMKEPYYQQIRDLTKTVEICTGDKEKRKIRCGDVIEFYHDPNKPDDTVACQVKKIVERTSFKAILEAVGYLNAFPDAQSIDEAEDVLYSFPGYLKEEELGVLAFCIEPVEGKET